MQQELSTIITTQHFMRFSRGDIFPKDTCPKSCNADPAEFTYSISRQLPHPEPKHRWAAKKNWDSSSPYYCCTSCCAGVIPLLC